MGRLAHALIVAAAATASGAALSQDRQLIGGRPVYSQLPDRDWVFFNEADSFQSNAWMKAEDGTAVVLIVSCTKSRGTIFLRHVENLKQDPVRITMVIRSGGRTMLSEEAEGDALGFMTRWVEKPNFLKAMRGLSGRTTLTMELQGGTNRRELTLRFRNDSGFRRAEQRCASLM
jgi:hypothetical protein